MKYILSLFPQFKSDMFAGICFPRHTISSLNIDALYNYLKEKLTKIMSQNSHSLAGETSQIDERKIENSHERLERIKKMKNIRKEKIKALRSDEPS